MDVIAHQYVGMQCDVVLQERAVQQVQKQLTVDIVSEIALVHTALGYVVRLFGQHQACLSRHGSSGLQEFIRLPPP
jgi:hypothetical protein